MNKSRVVLFVLPSIRISGGNLEAMKLAQELRSNGTDARILSLWKHPNSIERLDVSNIADIPIVHLSQFTPRRWRAPFDLLILMLRYPRYLREVRKKAGNRIPAIVLTHYSTFLFGWLTPLEQRYCFLQDEEWLFVSQGPHRQLLRKFILSTCARCKVITSNSYMTERAYAAGLSPVGETSIWAAPAFAEGSHEENRTVDIVMVLRQGRVKRLDLYRNLIAAIKQSGHLSCAVITCEDNIAAEVASSVDICLLRPTNEGMKELFQRSRIFVLLSEREGFGLPPLEAMGSGCVPLCRDAGGLHCYMTGSLKENLIPLDASLDLILRRISILLSNCEQLRRLSLESRQIFMDGLRESAEKRQNSLTLLSFV